MIRRFSDFLQNEVSAASRSISSVPKRQNCSCLEENTKHDSPIQFFYTAIRERSSKVLPSLKNERWTQTLVDSITLRTAIFTQLWCCCWLETLYLPKTLEQTKSVRQMGGNLQKLTISHDIIWKYCHKWSLSWMLKSLNWNCRVLRAIYTG